MSPSPPPGRTRLRTALRRGRAALPLQERQEQSEALRRVVVDHLRGAPTRPGGGDRAGHGRDDDSVTRPIVAAFLGLPPEPATEPILGELHELGFRIVLPVCEPDHQLGWAFWVPGVPLERSVHAAVDEPTGPRHAFADLSHVVLVLVPALGVDRAGNRLGQGGGYYDRFLAQHPRDAPDAVPRYAMVYRSELLPVGEVPAEPWDQPMSGVFTPDGPVEVHPSVRSGQ